MQKIQLSSLLQTMYNLKSVKEVFDIMTINEAIKTALDFENKVYNNYQQAEKKEKDPKGQKVFHTLALEELSHIKYLEHKLDEWKKSGHVQSQPSKHLSLIKKKLKSVFRDLLIA
jgi:rubrerythrin